MHELAYVPAICGHGLAAPPDQLSLDVDPQRGGGFVTLPHAAGVRVPALTLADFAPLTEAGCRAGGLRAPWAWPLVRNVASATSLLLRPRRSGARGIRAPGETGQRSLA